MGQAAILKSGTVVKVDGFTDLTYTIYGFLNVFTKDGKKYRETLVSDFRQEDQWYKDAIGGFYEEQFFLNYLAKKEGYRLDLLKEHFYNFEIVTTEDEITVKKMKMVAPYSDFYIRETYQWTYQLNSKVFDIATLQIVIPNNITSNPYQGQEIIPLNNTAMMFYNHKIGLFVNNVVNPDEKQAKAWLIAEIAIRINQIYRDVLSLFDIYTDFQGYLLSQETQWRFGNIFDNPTINTLTDYKTNLSIFYKSVYLNQKILQDATKKYKFKLLLKILSAEAISIIPTNSRLELLYDLSKPNVTLTEKNGGESLVLKIIESFTFTSNSSEDRAFLLEYLVDFHNYVYFIGPSPGPHEVENIKYTLFEILYKDIDDSRIDRYTFGLFHADNNRMKFILLLYGIWYSSKYNPYYADASYINAVNSLEVYTESPYMHLKNALNSSIKISNYYNINSPVCLIYETVEQVTVDTHIQTTTSYTYEIIGKSIYVYLIKTTVDKNDWENDAVESPKKLYGVYDFLQPITAIGLKTNLDLIYSFKDPANGQSLGDQKIHTIPAFLLFYMQDYSDLKKIDFGIMLVAELALNLTGVGTLSDLRYIGYLSKMRFLWTTETVAATDVVLGWSAVSGGINAFEFIALNALSLNNYVANTTDDIQTRDLAEKISKFLMWATIGTLILKPRIQRNLFGAASDLDSEVTQLMSDNIPIYRNLNPQQIIEFDQAMTVVRNLSGNIVVEIDGFATRMSTLELSEANIIAARFNGYSPSQKLAFYRDFVDVLSSEKTFWNKLNKASTLDNYEALRDLNVMERNEISIISSTARKNAYVRYYSDSNTGLRDALERSNGLQKRVAFFDEFGNEIPELFDKFVQKPEKITEWLEGNGLERSFLNNGKKLWLEAGYNLEEMKLLQKPIDNALETFIKKPKKRIPYDNPLLKDKAIAELATVCNIGDLTEVRMLKYFRELSEINSDRQFFTSVDIGFFGNTLKEKYLGTMVDIDALEFSVSQNKFVKVYSAKNLQGEGKMSLDTGRLNNEFKLIDDSSEASIHNFITNYYGLFVKQATKNKIKQVRIIMKDLSGNEIKMTVSDFQSKLKTNYGQSDWSEINLNNLGTSKTITNEGMYESIKNNLNN